MSKLITLVPTLPKRGVWANQTVILPSLGEQTFDAQGNLAVPDHQVLLLLRETQDSFGFTVLQVSKDEQQPSGAPDGALPTTEEVREAESRSQATGQPETDDDHEEGPEHSPLSEADLAALEQLSAKSAADQKIREDLDAQDLAGLLKVAAEFPDITKEQIAQMSDAKLRNELYARLTATIDGQV